MKTENLTYAKRLDAIGDLMIEISNGIKVGNMVSLKESIGKYEHVIDSLRDIIPPVKIADEHRALTKNLTKWITAVKQASELKDVNTVENAIDGQKHTELEIIKIIERIVEKFIQQ